jgi:site-specific DNA-methyltransferase (adenine-specific)
MDKRIELFNGDCFNKIKDLPDSSVDLVLTDPPYGIEYQSNHYKRIGSKFEVLQNDDNFKIPLEQILRVLKPTGCALIFYSHKKELIDIRKRNTLIWVKNNWTAGDLNGNFANQYECIAFFPKDSFRFNNVRPTNVFVFDRVPPTKLIHPTEKPVDLLRSLIVACTRPNGVVLDLFMGSGSTGEASLLSNRNFIGIEIDKGYFEIAKQRIEKISQQERLF